MYAGSSRTIPRLTHYLSAEELFHSRSTSGRLFRTPSTARGSHGENVAKAIERHYSVHCPPLQHGPGPTSWPSPPALSAGAMHMCALLWLACFSFGVCRQPSPARLSAPSPTPHVPGTSQLAQRTVRDVPPAIHLRRAACGLPAAMAARLRLMLQRGKENDFRDVSGAQEVKDEGDATDRGGGRDGASTINWPNLHIACVYSVRSTYMPKVSPQVGV